MKLLANGQAKILLAVVNKLEEVLGKVQSGLTWFYDLESNGQTILLNVYHAPKVHLTDRPRDGVTLELSPRVMEENPHKGMEYFMAILKCEDFQSFHIVNPEDINLEAPIREIVHNLVRRL